MIREVLKRIEEKVEKKSLGLSLTKIKTFETCPYRYYLQYIEKVKIPKSAYNPKFFKRGQAFHKILDNLIKTGLVCNFNSTTLGDEVNGIKNLCKEIYNSEFVQGLLKFEHKSEVPFSLFIEDGKITALNKIKKDSDLKGYIDFYAIDGDTLYVVDWKTGKIGRDEEDTYLQVYLYAKALELLLQKKFKKYVVGFYYVEHNEKLLKELTSEELDFKIENLLNKAYSIPTINDKSKFPAIPSGACKWCPFGKDSLDICEFSK